MSKISFSEQDKIRAYLRSLPYNSKKKNRRTPDKKEYSVFGRPLSHIPRQFSKTVGAFTSYLSETKRKKFKITSQIKEDVFEKSVDYIHRWTPVYRRSILAKLYQLEANLSQDQLRNVTMITLTTSQRGEDQEECLFKLLKYYNLLFKLLKHYIGKIDYFYILEPHKTGYAHMHIMYMKLLNTEEKKKITDLWEKRYKAGSHKGVDFAEPKMSEDGKCKSGSITHVRSYLMKYLVKGMYSETMSKGELLFNSLLKKNNIRLWGCSRNFSAIMRKPEKIENYDYECIKIELFQDGEFYSQIYPKIELVTPTPYNYSFSLSTSDLRIKPDHDEQAFHIFGG